MYATIQYLRCAKRFNRNPYLHTSKLGAKCTVLLLLVFQRLMIETIMAERLRKKWHQTLRTTASSFDAGFEHDQRASAHHAVPIQYKFLEQLQDPLQVEEQNAAIAVRPNATAPNFEGHKSGNLLSGNTIQKKFHPSAEAQQVVRPYAYQILGSMPSVAIQQMATEKDFAHDDLDKSTLNPSKNDSAWLQPSLSASKLPSVVQAKMETALGADFSDVNIHTESQQASHVGALAYALGNDVHFAPGQYDPHSTTGQELIGHELAHVVQQREGRVQPTTQARGVPVNDNKGLEVEADELGRKGAQMKVEEPVQVQSHSRHQGENHNFGHVVHGFIAETESGNNRGSTRQHKGAAVVAPNSVIQAKKAGPFNLAANIIAKFFKYSEYKDLSVPARELLIYNKLQGIYNDKLAKGTGYWKILQDKILKFGGDQRQAFELEQSQKRQEYDQKFEKNYVTTPKKTASKNQRELHSVGLGADGEKVNANKDVPYLNMADFQDNSITAAHNYAERDLAREADKANKDVVGYEKRGLANSEILWQQYRVAAEKQFVFNKKERALDLMKGLNKIKRRQVQNDETRGTILFALPDGFDDFSKPHQWQAGSEEFLALLGTPNCSGAVFMLSDHFDQLDKKSIASIDLLGGDDVNLDINLG